MSMGTLRATNKADMTPLNFGLPSEAARTFALLRSINDNLRSPMIMRHAGRAVEHGSGSTPIPPGAGKP